MAADAILDLVTYQVNEAARLLDLPDKTLRRWLNGDWKHGEYTPPIIRERESANWDLTWGEFIEAGLLAQYRSPDLPLERLRPLIEDLRVQLDTPYPLASARPLFSAGRTLLFQAQAKQGLTTDLLLVRGSDSALHRGYQLALTDVARAFVERVEFEPPGEGPAVRWFPWAERSKRIICEPEIAFGLPNIGGARTEAIAAMRHTGETTDDVVKAFKPFGLTQSDVDLAVGFERRLAAAA